MQATNPNTSTRKTKQKQTLTPEAKLLQLAKESITLANGRPVTALENLTDALYKENNAELEQALCKSTRPKEIIELLLTTFDALRAENYQVPDSRTARGELIYHKGLVSPSVPQQKKPRVTFAAMDSARGRYGNSILKTFIINGKPLGEVSAGEARGWASSRERDVKFIRALTEGLHDSLIIGGYRTDAEAAKVYKQASSPGV